MANPHKGEVEFASDGKTYIAAFSANVMAEIDSTIDAAAFERFSKGGGAAATVMRTIFWLAVRARHPEVDSEVKAGDLVAYHEMADICREGLLLATGGVKALEAYRAAIAKEADDGETSAASPPMPDREPQGSTGPALSDYGSN